MLAMLSAACHIVAGTQEYYTLNYNLLCIYLLFIFHVIALMS